VIFCVFSITGLSSLKHASPLSKNNSPHVDSYNSTFFDLVNGASEVERAPLGARTAAILAAYSSRVMISLQALPESLANTNQAAGACFVKRADENRQ